MLLALSDLLYCGRLCTLKLPHPSPRPYSCEFMEGFFERLIVLASTIDELLSDDFEPLPGQKRDADQAGRRLAAWCRSCASSDWGLFARRLERDGLTITNVLTRLATVGRSRV